MSTGRAASGAQAEVNWVLVDVEALVRGEVVVEAFDRALDHEVASLSLSEGDEARNSALGDRVLLDNAVGK